MQDQSTSRQPFVATQANIGAAAVKQRHLVAQPTQPGDMYCGLDGNSFSNIPIGTSGQVLMVVSGFPAWVSLLTTGVAANRPSSGTFTGQMYLSTDTDVLSVWNGSAWKTTTLT